MAFDVRRSQPLTITDANGKVTTGAYDRLGRLVKVWQPGHPTSGTPDVQYTYALSQSAASYVETKVLGPNGNQIASYEMLDGFLRPRQTQAITEAGKRMITDTAYGDRGLAVKTSVFYNSASAPTSTLVTPIDDAAVPRQVRYFYDGAGRLINEKLYKNNALQSETVTQYQGDRVGVIPPAGGTAVQDLFDARGRVVEKRQFHVATGFTGGFDKTLYAYDDANRLTKVTDPANNQWVYEYDLLGRRTKTIDPDAGTSTSTYDNAGQVLSTVDGRGQALFYEYDSLGRRTKTRDGSAAGPVLSQWTYDTNLKGQLTESIRHVGSDQYKTRVTSRDDTYRPLHAEVEIPNATTNGALAATYSYDYTYKQNGAPETVKLPGVGGLPAETLTHTYSDTGFAQSLAGSWTGGSQTYITDTDYFYDGLVSQQLLGAPGKRVRLSHSFAADTRRLASSSIGIETSTQGTFTTKYSTDYGWDQAGNMVYAAGMTDGAADQVECFRYDYLRRLTTAWTQASLGSGCQTPQRAGADPYWREWTFDSIGNRLTQVDRDSVAGDTTWTYQVGAAGGVKPHQLKKVDASGPKAGTATRTFAYDAAGNMTSATTAAGIGQSLTWDKEGHLQSVTEGSDTTSYVYDADGNRLIARTPSKTTLYLPDGTELDLPAGGGSLLGTRYYGGVAVRDASGLKWTCTNHQNTSVVQVDSVTLASTRRRMMPYGEDRGSQPSEWMGTKGYVGGTKDNTGYTHLGAREYDPTLGRFISRDPLMMLDSPQQINGYNYANNNPLTLSDPSGFGPVCGHEPGECNDSPNPPPSAPAPPCNGLPVCNPNPPPPGPPCGSCAPPGVPPCGNSGQPSCGGSSPAEDEPSLEKVAGAQPLAASLPLVDEVKEAMDQLYQRLQDLLGPLFEQLREIIEKAIKAAIALVLAHLVNVHRHAWVLAKICVVLCLSAFYQHGNFDFELPGGDFGGGGWKDLINPKNLKGLLRLLRIGGSVFVAAGWTTTEYKDRHKTNLEICGFYEVGGCYATGTRRDSSRWHAVSVGVGYGFSIAVDF